VFISVVLCMNDLVVGELTKYCCIVYSEVNIFEMSYSSVSFKNLEKKDKP
jgi:hypothetical protein